jgi:MFS family permease
MANPTMTSPHIAQQVAPVCIAPTKDETLTPNVFVDTEDKPTPKTSSGDETPGALFQPAPNGGLQAWMQVLMGHLVLINGWGYLSSFGLFQAHYTSTLDATPSAISWIGSMQIFLVYLVGTFSGRALDAGHFHKVLAIGSLLQIIGVFTTSVSSQYWQLFLAQGVCKGLGDGLVFCPTVSLVATYFSTRRSLAMAITASGGATGGIIFPLIAQQLLPRIGFGWTVRTMAFVILFNTIVILSIARVRLPPRKTGPIVEWSAFREPPYMLFCIGMFFNLWAVYFAYFYVSSSYIFVNIQF